MSNENKYRYWFIQKPTRHNCPINQGQGVEKESAVFTDFKPSISLKDCEWVKVFEELAVADLQSAIANLQAEVDDLKQSNKILLGADRDNVLISEKLIKSESKY